MQQGTLTPDALTYEAFLGVFVDAGLDARLGDDVLTVSSPGVEPRAAKTALMQRAGTGCTESPR